MAVIFDVDGVLVDSYHAHCESWGKLATHHGLRVSESQFAAVFGRTSREIIAELWHDQRLTSGKIAELDAEKEAIYRAIVAERFPAMDGAPELIHALDDAGFALAVGSSGPPENIFLTLDRLGVRVLISVVVTGLDVERGKPDPQVFLLAAGRLGIAPSRCAVVEDAPAGIAAANAGGMTSIALVSTGHSPESLAAAHLRVQSLRELTPQRIRGCVQSASRGWV
jgi:beta-phosphoglucomutase